MVREKMVSRYAQLQSQLLCTCGCNGKSKAGCRSEQHEIKQFQIWIWGQEMAEMGLNHSVQQLFAEASTYLQSILRLSCAAQLLQHRRKQRSPEQEYHGCMR